MWSKDYKIVVLIDFGGCEFIKQPLGQRSTTKFIGTMSYVSPEIVKLLNNKKG